MNKWFSGMMVVATMLVMAPAHADDVLGQWLKQGGQVERPAVVVHVEQASRSTEPIQVVPLRPSLDVFSQWTRQGSHEAVTDFSAPAGSERGAAQHVVLPEVPPPQHEATSPDMLQQYIGR